MSQDPQDIVRRPVRFRLEGMDDVAVSRDLAFPGADGGELAFDLYRPPGTTPEAALPVVVFVSGYSDPGAERMLGAKLKEWRFYQDWARLVAVSGMIAVTYTNRDPVGDVRALLAHLRSESASLGIDPLRMGVWACSGNTPNALSLLLEPPPARPSCAALCYGFLLDDDESSDVADAARAFFFSNPVAERRADELPADVPFLIVRAGADQTPGVNASIDRLVASALRHDLAATCLNHPRAPHAFDLEQEAEVSGPVVREILGFLEARLEASP